VWKCPGAFTALWYGAFKLSMAFVEQMTLRIYTSIIQEGNEFFPRFIPKLHDRWVSRALFIGHVS
jgi:hypothetical protein